MNLNKSIINKICQAAFENFKSKIKYANTKFKPMNITSKSINFILHQIKD